MENIDFVAFKKRGNEAIWWAEGSYAGHYSTMLVNQLRELEETSLLNEKSILLFRKKWNIHWPNKEKA